jgi:ribonuclease D
MVAHETILEPQAFRAAIAMWRHEPQLWLDTEVADWFTKTPRLSLLQVRNASGRIWVVDVLKKAEMRRALHEDFVSQVMANDQVEKWAHYARFERRFLGEDSVTNLKCTFELARLIPYYRLPLRSLTLAALVEHFFGETLDKTPQKSDWRVRPLSSEQLQYAALDTEWCYKIHDKLQRFSQPRDASEDDPAAITARYLALLGPLKSARTTREGIRDAVKEFMLHDKLRRLSRFSLQTRTTNSTDLATLIEFASLADPGEYFDLGIHLSARLRSLLGQDAQIKPIAEIRVSQSFRGPRAPRSREASPTSYVLDAGDVEALTDDYEAADHNVLILDSERTELRERMKRWMQAQSLEEWGDFRFSAPRERWKVDLRALGGVLSAHQAVQIAFPHRLWLAFQEPDLERLIAAGQSKQTPVLRWIPRALSVGPDAQQSRDWDEAVEGGETGEVE